MKRTAWLLLLVMPALAALMQPHDVAAQSSGAVKGRLLLSDGTPAKGHIVGVQSATAPDENLPREQWRAAFAKGALKGYVEAEVAADGAFTLKQVAVGKHSFDVRRPGEREPWCSIDGVTVKAGDTTDLGEIKVAKNGWQRMFDRKTLAGWSESKFFMPGKARVEDECIVIPSGSPMTGVTWRNEKDLPRVDYEVTLQARRVSGRDFFCALTFPVKKDPCTLVLGGWGGATVGLSNIDFADASMNDTTQSIDFELNRWYRVRLRVTQTRIQVWLDEDRIINQELEGRTISIRVECEASVPLGFATYRTTGAVRDVRIRKLD